MSDDEERPETPSLERRVTRAGRHVGDRYVRIVRPIGSGLRGHGGRYVATEQTMASTGRVGVDGTFAMYQSPLDSSTATRSVKVPPVSIPTRMPTGRRSSFSTNALLPDRARRRDAISPPPRWASEEVQNSSPHVVGLDKWPWPVHVAGPGRRPLRRSAPVCASRLWPPLGPIPAACRRRGVRA